MRIEKRFSENEFYLYMDGRLLYKRWFNLGYSRTFDRLPWSRYTEFSYTDLDIEDSPNIIMVKAKIRFRTEAEGGLNFPIENGYRPKHVFEYEEGGEINQEFVGEIQFNALEKLELGETYEINLRFPHAQRVDRFIEKGRKWWLYEGKVLIGEGEMLEVDIPEKKNVK